MTHINNQRPAHEEIVKFLVPRELKQALLQLAKERNIALSALMRLIASDYIKRNKTP